VVLKLQEVFNGVLVIGVDGDPFTTLCGWVDAIKPYRDFAL
jgi:hypothetical protein